MSVQITKSKNPLERWLKGKENMKAPDGRRIDDVIEVDDDEEAMVTCMARGGDGKLRVRALFAGEEPQFVEKVIGRSEREICGRFKLKADSIIFEYDPHNPSSNTLIVCLRKVRGAPEGIEELAHSM